MKHNLSTTAGFPLFFDSQALSLSDGGLLDFTRTVRRAVDLSQVLMRPQEVDPQTELYYMDEVVLHSPEQQAVLDRYGLTYSTVLLPARQIGAEFVKTHGHYHPALPGSEFEFPEVYTQLYGSLLLFMQKRSPVNPDLIEDCALAVMTPGFVITIPPGYAHILINTTQEPALMAGLYGKAFKPDYGPIRERQGLAYYIVASPDGFTSVANPRYPQAPPLRRLGELRGSIFEAPFADEPVWQAYFRSPDDYAFLTQQQAVQARFG